MTADDSGETGLTLGPLELPGWLEFISWLTGLKPRRYVEARGADRLIRCTYFIDARGRIRQPRHAPYTPVVFRSSRVRPSSITHDWLELASPLVSEMKERGCANHLLLSPDVQDVRPWNWDGFLVSVQYTYHVDQKMDQRVMSESVPRAMKKASKLGMRVDRSRDVQAVVRCIAQSEARQGFISRVTSRDLEAARDMLGEDGLRMYIGYDRDGLEVCSSVLLHAPGSRAMTWIGGTHQDYLPTGIATLVDHYSFQDVVAEGAVGVDYCGANLPTVAAFKSRFGSQLVPFYGVRNYSIRSAARFGLDWMRSNSKG